MPATPILTIPGAERLLSALEELLDKSEARYALIIDRAGFVISQHGDLPRSTDASTVAALAAGSFAATSELAARVGELEFSALYQQGKHCHLLMNAVDSDIVLVTVFGSNTTIGLVKFYSARTVRQIAAVMDEMRNTPVTEPVFTEQDAADATSGTPLFPE